MHFSTTPDNLHHALQMVSGVVPARSPLPILSGVLLQIEDSILYLTATDMEQGIRTSIPVNAKHPGAAVLPAKQFTELLRRLPEQDIDIKTDPETNVTVINYGQSEFTLHGFPPDEFPSLPEFYNQKPFTLTQGLLRKMLRQVLHAVSTEEHRPIFTGVLFESSDEKLNLVATDTHRLSLRSTSLDPEETGRLINVVVPGKTLNELVKLLSRDESRVRIYITDNHAFFYLDEVQVVTRLLKGNFPNYKMAIPDNITSEVKLNTRELMDAVDRALLLCTNTARQTIILQLQENTLTVFLNSETGTIREDIKVSNSGKNMDVGFNGRYLKEALRVMDAEEIYFQFTGPSTPALLKPLDSNEYISLLVPAAPGTEVSE